MFTAHHAEGITQAEVLNGEGVDQGLTASDSWLGVTELGEGQLAWVQVVDRGRCANGIIPASIAALPRPSAIV